MDRCKRWRNSCGRVDEPSLARPQLQAKLTQLNQELRAIYDSVQRETLVQESSFVLSHERELDLQNPLHEVLYELYSSVLERELAGFPNFDAQGN